MTSQDVVNVVRRAAGTRRVGHTGTLDPLATGLLLVLVGEATKLSEYMVGFDKTYEGTMKLGVTSDTYDIQGTVVPREGDAPLPTLQDLNTAAAPLTGLISQTPPPYSAVKVQGRKLYEYARSGEEVKAEPRQVEVRRYEISELQGDTARFLVECTSGTYVRSLVHDVGQAVGCGALVETLRRTRVADFSIDEAVPLDTIRNMTPEQFAELLAPMLDTVTELPLYYVTTTGREWLKKGQAIPMSLAEIDPDSRPGKVGDLVFLCPPGKDALAVAEIVPAPPSRPPASLSRHGGMWFQPVKLLMTEE